MSDILPEPRSRRPVPFGRWILATSLGWVLGIPVILLVSAGAEAVGLPAQFAIGLGMGATVGFLQWRQARRSFGASSAWFWASAVGMTCPFALCDLVGHGLEGSALIAPTALGALLVGLWQHRLFGVRGVKTYCWAPTLDDRMGTCCGDDSGTWHPRPSKVRTAVVATVPGSRQRWNRCEPDHGSCARLAVPAPA